MIPCESIAPPIVPGDPVKSCPFGRTHQGKCHTREGVQRAYDPSTTCSLPGRGFKVPCCPEYIGGIPYCQPPNIGLSCKWVTGPGGLGYDRCDNYQSYKDVAVNGELLNAPNYPLVNFDLDGYLNHALPIKLSDTQMKNIDSDWLVGIVVIVLIVAVAGGIWFTQATR